MSASRRNQLECKNPCTGETLCEPLACLTKEEVDEAVALSRQAQKEWAKTTFRERRAVLSDLLQDIIDQQEEICEVSCRETGKTMLEAQLGEVLTTCEKIRFTIKHGEGYLKPQSRSVPLLLLSKKARVEYHPMGVIGSIIPWNYPFHNIYGPLISVLFAGNGCVVKVSEYAAWSAEYFGSFVRRALEQNGHDPNLVQIIVGDGVTGEALVRSGVEKIMFIGSPENGKRVMRAAADNLTEVVLELGGKDPMIICDDCDWEQAINYALRGIFINCGQNCLAAERIYIQSNIYDRFVEEVTKRAKKLTQGPTVGTSRSCTVDCGAMTMPGQIAKVEALVQDALDKGAECVMGGKRNEEHPNGTFFEPTILKNCNHDMKIVTDEAFGPVMLLLKFDSDEEVIEYANCTEYGLSSCIFSKNYSRAEAMGSQIIAGSTIINDFGIPYMIQSLPFGGTKISGFGKFNGPEGLRGCCRTKAVVTDRWNFRTAMPRLLQYPTLPNGPAILRDATKMIFGRGLFYRTKALFGMVKGLLSAKKKKGSEGDE